MQPAIEKRDFQEAFPTDTEGNKIVRLYPTTIRKWRDLPLDVIYTVLEIDTKGDGYIAKLQSKSKKKFTVWIRERIYDQLKNCNMKENRIFIKLHGLKLCVNDPEKQ